MEYKKKLALDELRSQSQIKYTRMECPLCKINITNEEGISITINGLCFKCAKETYLVYKDLDMDKVEFKDNNLKGKKKWQ